ncbi:MAG: TonB-dependent receptor [Bdellovibrio sp.]|nr:TonB-dependent receptor [Bdellovibrio sp.]
MKSILLFALINLTFQSAFAIQELETVVTETKFNSSSRVVIDKEEIDKSRAKNITTLLATQANISIVQSNFTPTSIFMRGGDSGHILILVDGVPFYDASSIQRTINLNTIDIKSVQKIEVIKGSQSVLYGGQALTGVIKIETIPKELKSSGQVLIQEGNFNQNSVALGGLRAFDEHFGVVVRHSFSHKEATSPVLDSKKVYPTRLATGEIAGVYRAEFDAILKFQTSFDQTYISTTANPSFLAADADDFVTSTYQSTATGLINAKNFFWAPAISISHQENARQFEQDALLGSGTPTKQDYLGEVNVARLEFSPLKTTYFNLKIGGSYNQEKMVYRDLDVLKSDVQDEFAGLFAKSEVFLGDSVRLEAGSRTDYRRGKNAIATHQVGLTLFQILKFEYATGFKHPSLFQLYSAYGNPNLKPERSTSYSATIEGNLTENFFASITGFETRFENLILTKGFPLIYDNVSNSRTQGAEFVTGYRWLEQGMTFNLSLGYQEPKDTDQNVWLPRRPLRTASVKVRKEFEKIAAGVELVHNGERRDRTGATSYGTLNPYTLINATLEYQAKENVAFYVRGQNIFNQRYESNYGFYDEGTNVLVGAELSF